MSIPRLLVLSFLTLATVASAVAQSSPRANAVPGLVSPIQFGPGEVAAPHEATPFGQTSPFKLGTVAVNQFNLSQKTLKTISEGTWFNATQLRQLGPALNEVIRSRSQRACYAIRSYGFTRDDPASDATRFTGSSSCEPANSVQLKAAADPSATALH
jgi:hypothetical protein